LGLSVLMNLSQMLSGLMNLETGSAGGHVGPRLEEVLVEDNGSANKIAALTIDGIITGQPIDARGATMVDLVKAQLTRAKEDRRVKAVLLKVDSPGGEVLASDDIARALEEFQAESEKPIIVSMGSLAASGGYYISAPCRWIVANELTITGSIGVIMEAWNYRGLMNKVGLKPFVFKSGEHKDMLSGSRDLVDLPEEERQMIQGLIDQAYGRFKEVVSEGREFAARENGSDGKALVADWQNYADGRILTGKEAHQFGFVDQVGNFEDAVKKAIEIAGVDDANVVEYRQRHDISDIFRLFGETESRVVKLDIGVDMPKLEAGHLYFIWPTYLR
jgi:protease-4